MDIINNFDPNMKLIDFIRLVNDEDKKIVHGEVGGGAFIYATGVFEKIYLQASLSTMELKRAEVEQDIRLI